MEIHCLKIEKKENIKKFQVITHMNSSEIHKLLNYYFYMYFEDNRLKGVSSKHSGKRIVAPLFVF